jgi:hypothetical protein
MLICSSGASMLFWLGLSCVVIGVLIHHAAEYQNLPAMLRADETQSVEVQVLRHGASAG